MRNPLELKNKKWQIHNFDPAEALSDTILHYLTTDILNVPVYVYDGCPPPLYYQRNYNKNIR